MKTKLIMSGLLAVGLSAVSASACLLDIRVACPNDTAGVGVWVVIDNVFYVQTDSLGIAELSLSFGTHKVCVLQSSLPPGATLTPL